jgi:carbon-monoxide dehydrogenase medium subunit
MIPAPFSYRRAGSVAEALDLCAEYGDDAKFLAGGHSLLPLMKLRLAMPEVLIDLGPLRELSYIRDEGGHVAIGALTRHYDLEHSGVLARSVLAHAAGQVGDPQVRHRGTIGGSLAQ